MGNFTQQLHKRVYTFWLYMEALFGKIAAPGYVEAVENQNIMVIEAYTNASWQTKRIPSIDRSKDVQAVRGLLGPLYDHMPLTTYEAATEDVSGGDADDNLRRAALDMQQADSLGLERLTSGPANADEQDEA